MMTWLRHGVPIALLLDLYDRDGPSSRDIYRRETVADAVANDVVREAAELARSEAEAAARDPAREGGQAAV